ncbi:Small nuclear ribonucleoprotein E, partial [Musa troglodytarum]
PLAALVNPRKPLLSSGPRRSLGFQASRVGRGSDEGKGRERCDSEGEAAMASTKVQRIMTQPINLIFRFLQSKARIQIWLFEQKDLRIEGRIIGFDEYMNLVLEEAEELNVKKKTRKPLGRILLKGDNITLMMNTGK